MYNIKQKSALNAVWYSCCYNKHKTVKTALKPGSTGRSQIQPVKSKERGNMRA
jgi:hypothetical protein